ncbi:MAG: radical SAM protein [Lentisphaerae bacterium]|nr:radical SAM protein [Lentisphaerota bacterium]
MRIVWLAVNASHAHASLALPLLHLACSAQGELAWEAVSSTLHDDPGALAAAVVAREPDVVAATLYLFNSGLVLETLSRVKALRPGCTTIVGGPECLGEVGDLFARHPWVDLAVRGEGEAVLPELLERLRRAVAPSGLRGVCWRAADGTLHDDGSRAVSRSWPTAPPPCRSPFFDTSRAFVQIETSRGCRGACAYCTSCRDLPLRQRPLAAIRDELAALRDRGVREVRVLDRTFNAPAGRAGDLLALFLDEFPSMRFHLEIDPAGLSRGLRERLRRAAPGALHLEAGLQTTAPRALAACGRQADPARALDGLRFLVHETALPTHVDLLAGLPEQTLSDVEHDIEVLLDLGPAEIQLEVLKVLPGTPFWGSAKALGLCHAPLPPYEVLQTPACDAAGLRRVVAWSRCLDRFYNAAALQAVVREAVRTGGGVAVFAAASEADLGTAPAALERRFRFLAASAADRPGLLDAVRLAWLRAGLSPADPLPGAAPWKQPLPAGARWQAQPPAGSGATQRLWRLALSDRVVWVLYDRGQDERRPIAFAELPAGAAAT